MEPSVYAKVESLARQAETELNYRHEALSWAISLVSEIATHPDMPGYSQRYLREKLALLAGRCGCKLVQTEAD